MSTATEQSEAGARRPGGTAGESRALGWLGVASEAHSIWYRQTGHVSRK